MRRSTAEPDCFRRSVRVAFGGMPTRDTPSEFGGRVNALGIQPAPHVPTVNERLMLLYRTGDDSGLTKADDGEVFSGLLPLEKQIALRSAAGDLVKGELWEQIVVEGQSGVQELAATEGAGDVVA